MFRVELVRGRWVATQAWFVCAVWIRFIFGLDDHLGFFCRTILTISCSCEVPEHFVFPYWLDLLMLPESSEHKAAAPPTTETSHAFVED